MSELDNMAQRVARLERDRANRTRALLETEEEVVELRGQMQLMRAQMATLRDANDQLRAELEADRASEETSHAALGET